MFVHHIMAKFEHITPTSIGNTCLLMNFSTFFWFWDSSRSFSGWIVSANYPWGNHVWWTCSAHLDTFRVQPWRETNKNTCKKRHPRPPPPRISPKQEWKIAFRKVHSKRRAHLWVWPPPNNSDHQNDIHVSLKRSVTKTSPSVRKDQDPKKIKHTLPVLTRTTLNIIMEPPQNHPIRKGNSSSKFQPPYLRFQPSSFFRGCKNQHMT